MDAFFASIVHVNILGDVLKPGTGVVHACPAPVGNAEAGRVVNSVRIVAEPPQRSRLV